MAQMIFGNRVLKTETDGDEGGARGEGGAAGGPGGVGRLVDSSQADDRRMIRLVRERRLLYSRNNMPVASYYTQVKSLWEEVANEMGWSVGDVRRKWSHIRNSYSRHLRNELGGARTGRGRMVSRWYLADELEFLREHMATDTRMSYSAYAPTFLEMDMTEQSVSSETVDVKPFAGASWYSAGQSSSPAATPAPAAGSAAPPKPEPHSAHSEDSSSSQFSPDETASYFQFFRGLHPDYAELSARKQRLFKRQCVALLYELLDDEDEAVNLSQSPAAAAAAAPHAAAYILPND